MYSITVFNWLYIYIYWSDIKTTIVTINTMKLRRERRQASLDILLLTFGTLLIRGLGEGLAVVLDVLKMCIYSYFLPVIKSVCLRR